MIAALNKASPCIKETSNTTCITGASNGPLESPPGSNGPVNPFAIGDAIKAAEDAQK
jgi:hypothetical protein